MAAPTLSKTGVGMRSQDRLTPSLENGDHLTRAEFERRYAASPHIKKADLVEGVVYVSSPVSIEHSKRHAAVMVWLGTYQVATPGVEVLDNATVRLDAENEVQPDAALYRVSKGQTTVIDDYLHGAPELVVEVAMSSASYDLYDKHRVYRRTGVREYVILLTHERETVWNRLENGRYVTIQPDDAGVIHSVVFPGLYFHSAHFWEDNRAELLKVLAQGLAAPEHAAFVAALTAAG